MKADPQMYVRLAEHTLLRRLEEPSLYDRKNDELYELNQEGLQALQRCRGDMRLEEVGLEEEFLKLCLEEGLIELSDQPHPRPLVVADSPQPSLRYLELQVTWRCNLSCRHCYLGKARSVDMPPDQAARLLCEFEDMGGLRVLISGGEPLAHPRWNEINTALASTGVRRVLLSNGTLLSERLLSQLNVDEVQISLDGLRYGHEALRGVGSYAQAIKAARMVGETGLDLSLATMVHSGNVDEFKELAGVVNELGAKEWGIDAPCLAGRLSDHADLAVTPAQAAQAMEFAYGGAFHGGSRGMACGLHLCTVAPDGKVAQCGFYFDRPLGLASEGLWACWVRRRPLALSSIGGCCDCEVGEDCGGGCRFRAPHPLEPDPVMCALYNQS